MNERNPTSVIESSLQELGIRAHASGRGYHFLYQGRETRYAAELGVQRRDLFVTLLHLPQIVPPARRSAACELASRINFGRAVGRFDVDCSDGGLNWAATIPLRDAVLSSGQVISVLMSGMDLVDRYARCFTRLIYDAELSPAEAFAEVEMAADEDQDEDDC